MWPVICFVATLHGASATCPTPFLVPSDISVRSDSQDGVRYKTQDVRYGFKDQTVTVRSSHLPVYISPRHLSLSSAHAAPRVWNSLPHTITDDLNISAPVFKSRLKTFLYTTSYPLCDLNCARDLSNRPTYGVFLNLFTYLLAYLLAFLFTPVWMTSSDL